MVFGANHPNLRRFSLRLEVPHIDRDASPEASELEASNCWGTRFQPRSRYMGAFLNLGLLLVWYGVMTLMFDVGWCGSIIWSIFDLGIFQACKITLGLNVFFIFHIFHICQVLVTRSFAAVSQAVAHVATRVACSDRPDDIKTDDKWMLDICLSSSWYYNINPIHIYSSCHCLLCLDLCLSEFVCRYIIICTLYLLLLFIIIIINYHYYHLLPLLLLLLLYTYIQIICK